MFYEETKKKNILETEYKRTKAFTDLNKIEES